VLLVEDDPVCQMHYGAILAKEYNVDKATNVAEGIAKLNDPDIEGVVLDLGLPNGQGLEVIERFQAARPGIPILVVTNYDFSASDVIQRGAQDILRKTYMSPQDMLSSLRRAIARHLVRGVLKPIREAAQAVSKGLEKIEQKAREREEKSPLPSE